MRVSPRAGSARPSAIEFLEARQLLSAAPVHPHHQAAAHEHSRRSHAVHVKPALIREKHHSSTYIGYGHKPSDIRTVYGFGALANQGAGQTIGIVDAYDDPNIANDLSVFDKQFGLPGTTTNAAYNPTSNTGDPNSVYNFFSKVGQTGSATSRPVSNGSWAQEISLDVEWAHSIAPGANILLVEANSNSTNDLLAAVDYAKTQASVVSMSWGGSEFSTESSYDSHFTSPPGHPVTFVASAGDTGGQREWPAESPNVVSVGGTTLSFTNQNAYNGETGWVDSGGGSSAYEAKPAYQNPSTLPSYQAALAKSNNRSGPDVAYDADPNSGFAVYDSLRYNRQSGWMVFGGTSAGAPQWAALIAVADQGRASLGKAALDGTNDTLPALYDGAVPTSVDNTSGGDLHDVDPNPATTTSGGTSTGQGYDQITGLGTPFNAQNLIQDLVNV